MSISPVRTDPGMQPHPNAQANNLKKAVAGGIVCALGIACVVGALALPLLIHNKPVDSYAKSAFNASRSSSSVEGSCETLVSLMNSIINSNVSFPTNARCQWSYGCNDGKVTGSFLDWKNIDKKDSKDRLKLAHLQSDFSTYASTVCGIKWPAKMPSKVEGSCETLASILNSHVSFPPNARCQWSYGCNDSKVTGSFLDWKNIDKKDSKDWLKLAHLQSDFSKYASTACQLEMPAKMKSN